MGTLTDGMKQAVRVQMWKHAPHLYFRLSNTFRDRPPAIDRSELTDLFPPGSEGAEIGVHLGDFSAALLQRVAPSRLVLIDPWAVSTTAEGGLYAKKAGVEQADMDMRCKYVAYRFAAHPEVTVVRDFSTDALRSMPADSLDWVYIDGDHRMEAVTADIECAFRVVRDGGLITGDDYGEGGWWSGGVKHAVDAIKGRNGYEFLFARSKQFAFRIHKS